MSFTSSPSSSAAPPAASRRQGWGKALIAVAAIAAVITATRLLPVGEWLEAFNLWVSGLGAWGPVIFVLAYVVATVLFLPGSVLTLGAGFVFGLVKGTIVVSVGATLGCAAAFLISRTFARGLISQRFAANERFRAVDRAIGAQGTKIVLLVRLSPVFPFNVLNYLLGLTAVRFWPYVFASWIGMLPGTLLYVYLGRIGRAGVEAASTPAGVDSLRFVYLGAGLLATLAVTIFITRLARRELRRASEGKEFVS